MVITINGVAKFKVNPIQIIKNSPSSILESEIGRFLTEENIMNWYQFFEDNVEDIRVTTEGSLVKMDFSAASYSWEDDASSFEALVEFLSTQMDSGSLICKCYEDNGSELEWQVMNGNMFWMRPVKIPVPRDSIESTIALALWSKLSEIYSDCLKKLDEKIEELELDAQALFNYKRVREAVSSLLIEQSIEMIFGGSK